MSKRQRGGILVEASIVLLSIVVLAIPALPTIKDAAETEYCKAGYFIAGGTISAAGPSSGGLDPEIFDAMPRQCQDSIIRYVNNGGS